MDTITQINYSIHFNYYFLIGGLFLGYLVYRIIHSLLGDNTFTQTKYRVRGHTWRNIDCNKSIPYNIYCTVCSKLMLPVVGLFCECCAVSACTKCHRIVDKRNRCKQITWPIGKTFNHLWVNVGAANRNNADHSEDGELLINKYFCSWCQRTKVSQENLLDNNEQCDFQKYKNIIIPPANVQVEKGKIVNIKPLSNENWEPLIIFANRKSGSNRSDEVLSIFRGLLNPLQVIDISSTPPERAVRWFPARCRVLVAGGDGTVAWVLNALHSVPHVKATVGILPMGTGNDLSRALGWGASCSDLDAHAIVTSLQQAQEQIIDRWKVTITPKHVLGRLRARAARELFAYNYASIGVDAQVALDFHRARATFLYRYTSQYLNYLTYALLGVGRVLDAGTSGGLERRLRVRAGERELSLPPLQALVALNIPSWGAGVDLWSLGSEDEVQEQRMDDGKLEVVGISSSFQIARLQVGLAEPYRFTQASDVWIELDGCCAMQVDGEPWMQGPASIHIEPAGRSTLLRPRR
ncbi:diacylglycerol kinase epsilon [Bicyclus anynana]|uniref:Diacylglycerol kinase n=1 Tax=Bicyclus anynana TaxID=110368 RepID=A0ABM3LMA3_BICAN|nr:diacylglycerol kinase epsilon [Bicyclus anynana]